MPLKVKEKAPTGIEVGRIASNSGVGFASVAAVFPDLVLSAVSTAVIVMVFGVGGNSGAVYRPVALIVPSDALPPATPFTDHVSVGFEPSLVFTVNCCCVNPATVGFVGVTVIVKGSGPPPPPLPPAAVN